MESNITCNQVTYHDLEMLMHWRMLPQVTNFMKTQPNLTMDNQIKWFKKIQNSNTQYHWIINVDEVPIGVINVHGIDWDIKNCSTGIYIVERSKSSVKLYFELHWNLFDMIFDTMELNKIYAEILSWNTGAVALSKRAWPVWHDEGEYILLENTPSVWNEYKKSIKYSKIVFEYNGNKYGRG